MKRKVHIICIFLFIIALLACKENNTDKIKVFIQNYIETVSIEHEKYKTNVTDKMTAYFYDDENKENADLPEFLLLGPFRNDILIVKNYDIQKVRKLPRKDIDRYSVNVQFTIYDESKENGEYVRDVEYWVVLVNNKFYIYGDVFLKDIFILEKDLNR
jgi:hypothetical protein